jgi:hypothetical protein
MWKVFLEAFLRCKPVLQCPAVKFDICFRLNFVQQRNSKVNNVRRPIFETAHEDIHSAKERERKREREREREIEIEIKRERERERKRESDK